MRRFVAEHAAAAAGARGGEGGTRCSIFTLCLIADLGVDYINLIPHACALSLFGWGERCGGIVLRRGERVVLILAGGVFSLFLSLSRASDHLRISSNPPCSRHDSFSVLFAGRGGGGRSVGRRARGKGGGKFYRETELSLVEGGEIPRTVFKNNAGGRRVRGLMRG